MPQIGRPRSLDKNDYASVTMAPKNRLPDESKKNTIGTDQVEQKKRERLLNKLTGFKPKNDLFVDGKKHNKMGKDEFLKLLTHQLQNQDPMKPMEQNKMAAELAQFSQLEQLANLNTKFDGMNKDAKIKGKFYGASFLGKEIVTNGSSLNFNGEEGDILFNMPVPAKKVMVRIFDKKNNLISEMWKENIGRGSQNLIWDGRGLDGSVQVSGEYRVDVKAWDKFSEPIDVATKVKGVVGSVFFEGGETVLSVDGKKVFLRDVESFHTKDSSQVNTDKSSGPKTNPGVSLGDISNKDNTMSKKLLSQNKFDPSVNLNNKKTKNVNAPATNYKRKVNTGITNVYDME